MPRVSGGGRQLMLRVPTLRIAVLRIPMLWISG